MRQDILDRRRKEKWDITLWCTQGSVIVQVILPENGERGDYPAIDIACVDFATALKFARAVCRRTPQEIGAASALVFNWAKTSPEIFLALMSNKPAPA